MVFRIFYLNFFKEKELIKKKTNIKRLAKLFLFKKKFIPIINRHFLEKQYLHGFFSVLYLFIYYQSDFIF